MRGAHCCVVGSRAKHMIWRYSTEVFLCQNKGDNFVIIIRVQQKALRWFQTGCQFEANDAVDTGAINTDGNRSLQ